MDEQKTTETTENSTAPIVEQTAPAAAAPTTPAAKTASTQSGSTTTPTRTFAAKRAVGKRPTRTGGPSAGGYRGNSPAGAGAVGADGKKAPFAKRRLGGKDQKGGKRLPVKSDLDQKILQIRRVTRVVAGGRRFSFSVVLAIGDKKGSLGVGIGKAQDTSSAIQKALTQAKKNLMKLTLTKTFSIPHGVDAKYSSAVVNIRPNFGRGIVAGSALRVLIELGGLKDITGKVLSRSKNKLNNAQALLKALEIFADKKRGYQPKASELSDAPRTGYRGDFKKPYTPRTA